MHPFPDIDNQHIGLFGREAEQLNEPASPTARTARAAADQPNTDPPDEQQQKGIARFLAEVHQREHERDDHAVPARHPKDWQDHATDHHDAEPRMESAEVRFRHSANEPHKQNNTREHAQRGVEPATIRDKADRQYDKRPDIESQELLTAHEVDCGKCNRIPPSLVQIDEQTTWFVTG